MAKEYMWKSLRVGKYGGVDVVGFKRMPRGSVLAGQTVTCFIDNYEDEEAAHKAYPDAEGYVNKFTAPRVSLAHLPGENDPVPGGMFPDDYR